MRIIITGATGQVGRALQKVLAGQGLNILDTPRFDVADPAVVQQLAELRPELIIHSAAMTNVDGCARDPDLAFKVNAFGAQNVAHACLRCNAELYVVLRVCDRVIVEHLEIGPASNWPRGYFA